MKILSVIFSLILLGIVGLLCSFFIIANAFKDEFWEAIKEKEGGEDDRE